MIAYMLWHQVILDFPDNYPWETYINQTNVYTHVNPIRTFQRHPYEPDIPYIYGWKVFRIDMKRLS